MWSRELILMTTLHKHREGEGATRWFISIDNLVTKRLVYLNRSLRRRRRTKQTFHRSREDRLVDVRSPRRSDDNTCSLRFRWHIQVYICRLFDNIGNRLSKSLKNPSSIKVTLMVWYLIFNMQWPYSPMKWPITLVPALFFSISLLNLYSKCSLSGHRVVQNMLPSWNTTNYVASNVFSVILNTNFSSTNRLYRPTSISSVNNEASSFCLVQTIAQSSSIMWIVDDLIGTDRKTHDRCAQSST